MTDSPITLAKLNHFPIKGMTAQPLDAVELQPGEGVPNDRLFGFARYDSGFDPENPKPLPKQRFVVLANEPSLAGLKTSFDNETRVLQISNDGETHTFDMRSEKDQLAAAEFLHMSLSLSDPEPPKFVSSMPHRFTDVSVDSAQMMNAVSVLNLASVRELEQRLESEVDPARFRANLEIDGPKPFSELESVGAVIKLGEVTLRILKRTKRCPATEVNPQTAVKDVRVPFLLQKHFGHFDMGVYAEVLSGGSLAPGQKGILETS